MDEERKRRREEEKKRRKRRKRRKENSLTDVWIDHQKPFCCSLRQNSA